MATAESLGFAPALDQRVVARVLAHLHDQGSSWRQPCAVNVSAASIADPDWTRELGELLRASGVLPGRVVFEISERSAMENIDATAAFISQVRSLGARAALDDFGAGFSSFYYLRHFEVDYLKIGSAFTRELDDNPESRAFIRAVTGLARDLKRQVIAKGVETEPALRLLRESGALYAQGRFFRGAEPLQADETRRVAASGG